MYNLSYICIIYFFPILQTNLNSDSRADTKGTLTGAFDSNNFFLDFTKKKEPLGEQKQICAGRGIKGIFGIIPISCKWMLEYSHVFTAGLCPEYSVNFVLYFKHEYSFIADRTSHITDILLLQHLIMHHFFLPAKKNYDLNNGS